MGANEIRESAPEKKERPESMYSIMLFLVAVIWGSCFFIMKGAINDMPVNSLLMYRFLIAALVIGAIFWKKIRACFSWDYIWRGVLIGVTVYLGSFFQTYGLYDTTAGKAAFLTATYVVMIPFMCWIVRRGRPDRYNIIAAVILICGIGFITLEGSLSIRFGDWLELLCALCFGLQYVLTAAFVRDRDPIVITFWLFLGTGIISAVVSLTTETQLPFSAWTPQLTLSVLYLAIFVTGLAFVWQTVAQVHVSPMRTSVLLSLESVFGALFGILFGGDALTIKIFIGFVLVFCAVTISETKLAFLRKGSGS